MVAIPKEFERYSWADYQSWSEDERWELNQGVAWSMSPAPTRTHQKMLIEFGRQFGNFLLDKPCEAFMAPFDVKLSTDEEDQFPTVFQPDLLLCCDPKKSTEKGIMGAPDLVLEILSPSTGLRDRREKFEAYEKYGVGEYWIIDPTTGVLEIYRLNGKKYERFGAFASGQEVSPFALPELKIDLTLVFGEPVPGQKTESLENN